MALHNASRRPAPSSAKGASNRMSAEVRLIPFRGGFIKTERDPTGLFRDSFGTVFAFSSAAGSVNADDNRCGVGIFSLPKSSIYNEACRSHDFMYSCPAYQRFNSRAESDLYLKKQLQHYGAVIIDDVFYGLARAFGGQFWEEGGAIETETYQTSRSVERPSELRLYGGTEASVSVGGDINKTNCGGEE